MKIIVLAGGLSTERDVSLSSAAGICRTLVEKGHDAFLLDVFMGLENAPENLEDVFTLPDHGLEIVKNISTEEPDLEAVWLTLLSSVFTVEKVRTESFRHLSICLVLNIQDLTLLDVRLQCIKVLQSRSSLSLA